MVDLVKRLGLFRAAVYANGGSDAVREDEGLFLYTVLKLRVLLYIRKCLKWFSATLCNTDSMHCDG